jgi:hypothetical protein
VGKTQNRPQFSVRKREKTVEKPCAFFNRTLRLGYIPDDRSTLGQRSTEKTIPPKG